MPSRGAAAWLVVAILVGLGLRIWEAQGESLWIDELHTLHHASQPDVASVLASVRRDVHAPPFFVFVHWFGGWEQGAWLRAIPIASSLLVLIPLLQLAQMLGLSRGGTWLAAWLYACMPYQVHYGAELRPYCWIGLCSAVMVVVALSERGRRSVRLAAFAALVFAGMWIHRLMVVTLAAVAGARMFVRRPRMLPFFALVGAGALGLAAFVPWLLAFAESASVSREVHDAALHGRLIRPTLLKEILVLPLRLVLPYGSFLGQPWSGLAFAGAAVFGVAVVVALFLCWRARRTPHDPAARATLRGLTLFALGSFLATACLAVYRSDAVPLQYFNAMAWALPLVVAAWCDREASGTARRALFATLAVCTLVMGIATAVGKTREDTRLAVATARAFGAELDAPIYTSLMKQPPIFPDGLPYRAYARDIEPVERVDLPQPGQPGHARPLVVITRKVAPWRREWQPILAGRKLVREVKIDWYLGVQVYAPE